MKTNGNALTKNKIFAHLLRYGKAYLVALTLFLLSFPLLTNLLLGKPLVVGSESYYHLLSAQQVSGANWIYFPLHWAQEYFPEGLFLLPLALALGSLLLFFSLGDRMGFSKHFTLFFGMLIVLSPAFIYTFSTISAYSFFLFLLLAGFFLLTRKKQVLRGLSLLPFAAATFFDGFNTLLLIFFQAAYLNRNRKDFLAWTGISLSGLLLLFNLLFLNLKFIQGPFHSQQGFADLVSDFGGLHGVGFFVILLAVIGLAFTWKHRKFYWAYFLAPIVAYGYLSNTQTVFPASLLLAFFAAAGFSWLFERRWVLESIQKFTLLLLLLGVLFSTLAYLERISETSPTPSDLQTYLWIKENTPQESVILSAPENSNLLEYFSGRKPTYYFREETNLTASIFGASYISELFPLLEENNVSYIYITPRMKSQLPLDQGFLFLLKNERFKMVYSSEESEVWLFEREKLEAEKR